MEKSSFSRVAWLPIAGLLLLLSARAASAAAATDLGIRATVGSFRVGLIGTYTVTVFNAGPATTDAPIHVLDTLPAGLSFSDVVSSVFTCSASGQLVDCVMAGPLSTGTTTTFRLHVSICTAAYPTVTNTLRLDYPGDTNAANNSITKTKVVKPGSCTPPSVTPTGRPTATPIPGTPRTPTRTVSPTPTPTSVPAAANLQLTKTTSSTFTVGGTGLYTLNVSNLGPGGTNGVITIVDSLPTGLTFVSSSGTGWTCSASAQTVTCTTPSLVPAGSSSAVTLSVAVGSAAYPTVTNSAAVSYAGDPDTTNNTAYKPTTIRN